MLVLYLFFSDARPHHSNIEFIQQIWAGCFYDNLIIIFCPFLAYGLCSRSSYLAGFRLKVCQISVSRPFCCIASITNLARPSASSIVG